MKFRSIPPAGTPIFVKELLSWLFESIAGVDRRNDLCEAIKRRYEMKHCFLMSSGRAAMAMLFQIMKDNRDDPRRDEILLPSYTCYSVPAAAEIAGLKIRVCDIDPGTLSYDREQLESVDLSRVLCVVSANLYGYPDELEYLETMAANAGCYMIDDSAQAMEAIHHDRYCGTFGDIGLFSLDKGKNITSLQGGIVVTNDDLLAEKIGAAIDRMPKVGAGQALTDGLKLLIYSLLLKPYLYWIPSSLPFLGLGKTPYTTDYLYSQYSRSMASLSIRLFNRIEEITRQRQTRSAKTLEKLKEINGLSFLSPVDERTFPVHLRTPVLIDDAKRRNAIIDALQTKGIGATASYPKSIADLKETAGFTTIHNNRAENGRYIASHIITLPSMRYLNGNDIEIIRQVFEDQLRQ